MVGLPWSGATIGLSSQWTSGSRFVWLDKPTVAPANLAVLRHHSWDFLRCLHAAGAPAPRPRRASHLDARLDTRLDTPTLSPWRLERRRVLDAAGVGLVLGPARRHERVRAGGCA